MKILGVFFIAICPIIYGFNHSKNLKQNKNKIEKIIELLNHIMTEIRFKKTDINSLFYNLSSDENFKRLEFLQNFKNLENKKPFPQKWNEAIKNWDCSLSTNDKDKLKSLSNILGLTDSKGQIVAIKHVKAQFEESLHKAKKIYLKKGKISRSLGTLIGIAIFIILI